MLGVLLLALAPLAARAQTEAPEASDAVELYDYAVREGESCASIARRLWGHARHVDVIHRHNELGPTPHRLRTGQILRLPREVDGHASGEVGPDARVTAARRDVRARSVEAEEWEAARLGLGLFRGWRVSTFARSSAELTFRDTSIVSLREDTLVVIFGATATRVRREGTEATLERGVLRSRLAELRGLEVQAPEASIELTGGSAVVRVDDEGTAQVSNHAGADARIGATTERARTRVSPGFGSRIRRGERAAEPPRPLPPAPDWLAGPRRFLAIAGRGGTITGAWSPVATARVYRVELARRADGTDLAAAIEVPAEVTRFEVHGLPAGAYHVRVSVIDGDFFESRPSASLVLRIDEARVVGPDASAATGTELVLDGASDELVAPPPLHVLVGTRMAMPEGVRCTLDAGEPRAEVVVRAPGPLALRCIDEDGRLVGAFSLHAEGAVLASQSGDAVRAVRGGEPIEVRLTASATLPLPADATITADTGLELDEVRREGDALVVRLRARLMSPDRVTLRLVSPSTPDVTLGALDVEAVLPDRMPDETSAALPGSVIVQPALSDVASDLYFPSALALRGERRGFGAAIAAGYLAPVDEHDRLRFAIAGWASFLDDRLTLQAVLPFDVLGVHRSTWQRGSGDLLGSITWNALDRQPGARETLGVAVDVGAWFPTHAGVGRAEERSGLDVVRLFASVHAALTLEHRVTLRTRQGLLIDLDAIGGRLWASAYGLDVHLWGPFVIALEGELTVGPELEADLVAVAMAASLSVTLEPVQVSLGTRFGASDDGIALFGPASLLLSGSVHW